MDIRCGNCSKLFRVADEKIAGKGIRFKCSRCSDVITVTKQDLEMDLLAREGGDEVPVFQEPAPPPPAPPRPPEPAVPEAREYQPQAPPVQDAPPVEFEPQEYRAPDAPRAGFDGFDTGGAPAAGFEAGADDAGDDVAFSFGGEQEGGSPEISLSEDDAKDAEAAISFPDDLISEPARKPAFAATEPEPGRPAAGAEEDGGFSFDAGPETGADASGAGGESGFSFDTGPEQGSAAMEENIPDLKTPASPPGPAAERPKGPVFTPPPKSGPVITPPPKPRRAAAKPPAPQEDEEIDLAAALKLPPMGGETMPDIPESRSAMDDPGPARTAAANQPIHPLGSGTATGAVAGLGCALPVVLLLTLGFGMVMQFLPFLAGMPVYHLVAALGAGIFSMAVMISVLIAVLQARAGRKLFFLVNMLIGTVFGAGFGAALDATVALASGRGPDPAAILTSAASWAVFALLLSIVVVIVRRIMVFSRDETFGASLTGLQKAGAALSLVIVLGALYLQGTLTGKLEQSAQGMLQQAGEEITPEGLLVENANAYIDPATGDLVITGTIRNTTDRPKPGWYLDVDVYDGSRNVVATVSLVNGVQLFRPQDYAVLAQRGTDVSELQAKMLLAAGSAAVPAGGSVQFEAHLLTPPAGIAGFLPVLRKFDPLTVFGRMAEEMDRQ